MQTAELNILIGKYLDETIQADERQRLSAMLADPSCVPLLEEMMTEQLAEKIYTLEPDQEIRQSIDQYLDRHTKPVRRTLSFRYAAAILLLIGAATLAVVFFGNNKKQPTAIQTADIAPGGNKAMLTLADGTVISLDSAGNGMLAQQGNAQVVKLANGQILYRMQSGSAKEMMINKISTPRGGQYQVTLPDGSKVWLNAASTLTYPAVFTGKERKVKVSGEAYFEIVQDAAKPFMVDIDGKSSVQVLGTQFNVNSYADDGHIRTTLLEGSIRADNLLLKPGQQAVTGKGLEEQVNINQVIAWKQGIFNFQDQDLTTVMKQIERWYDVDVQYEGAVPDIRFKGKMDRGVSLSGVLRFLDEFDIHTKLDGRTLTITK